MILFTESNKNVSKRTPLSAYFEFYLLIPGSVLLRWFISAMFSTQLLNVLMDGVNILVKTHVENLVYYLKTLSESKS